MPLIHCFVLKRFSIPTYRTFHSLLLHILDSDRAKWFMVCNKYAFPHVSIPEFGLYFLLYLDVSVSLRGSMNWGLSVVFSMGSYFDHLHFHDLLHDYWCVHFMAACSFPFPCNSTLFVVSSSCISLVWQVFAFSPCFEML